MQKYLNVCDKMNILIRGIFGVLCGIIFLYPRRFFIDKKR